MSILVKKGGVLSTIQDLGRTEFRRFGINPNGAMDAAAARLINVLLGNDESEAVLETHFPAPLLRFETAATLAVGGANFAARIDDQSIERWRPIRVEENQCLSFGEKISGNRAYLAVKGGFKIEKWLRSASTNLAASVGGFEGRSLRKGDKLFLNEKTEISAPKFLYKLSREILPRYSSFPTVRVTAGAEFEKLTAIGEQIFLNENFVVSEDSNRMGFRLRGTPIYLLNNAELASSAVSIGTIQLTPDGQLIVLMADAQTTGGYPRIAHVVSTDLPILAQLGAGEKVAFELISIEEAENLRLDFETNLNLLKIGVNSK